MKIVLANPRGFAPESIAPSVLSSGPWNCTARRFMYATR